MPPRTVFVAGALAVVIVGAAGLAGAASHPAAAPRVADVFSVFGDHGAPSTARDRVVGERVAATLGLPRLRGESTRTAHTFGDGTVVRVLGGGGDYCLFKDEGQSLTCAKLAGGASPVLVLGAGYDEPVASAQFAAMVGDGATEFELAVEEGGPVALTPRHNVVAADVPGRPLRLTWRNADGSPGALRFDRG